MNVDATSFRMESAGAVPKLQFGPVIALCRGEEGGNSVGSKDDAPPEINQLRLQPLTEVPALVLADKSRNIRGWEIRGQDGRVLGVVADLLADTDRLVAEFVIVSPAEPGGIRPLVALSGLSAGRDHLVVGAGLPPIALRYRSTARLTAWTAGTAALFVLIVWALRLAAC
jgi:hypothetical protein